MLDVKEREIWAAPELGQASWEAVAAGETEASNTIGLVIGDDFAPASLYYWEGEKDAIGDDSFLDRNGLARGQLFYTVPTSSLSTMATIPNSKISESAARTILSGRTTRRLVAASI